MALRALDAPELPMDAPLLPFEQRQLQNLIQQVEAASDRIRNAFYDHITGIDEFHRS